jgi:hypothetical protein
VPLHPIKALTNLSQGLTHFECKLVLATYNRIIMDNGTARKLLYEFAVVICLFFAIRRNFARTSSTSRQFRSMRPGWPPVASSRRLVTKSAQKCTLSPSVTPVKAQMCCYFNIHVTFRAHAGVTVRHPDPGVSNDSMTPETASYAHSWVNCCRPIPLPQAYVPTNPSDARRSIHAPVAV